MTYNPLKNDYKKSKVSSMIPFELCDSLSHTWFFDIDGTIVRVNQPPYDNDVLLLGVKKLWSEIPANDIIIITTARPEEYQYKTMTFIEENGLRYDRVLFGIAHGERIVVNDNKPGGLRCAIAWNVKRNRGY